MKIIERIIWYTWVEWKNEKRLMKARGNKLRQAYLSFIEHKNLTPQACGQFISTSKSKLHTAYYSRADE